MAKKQRGQRLHLDNLQEVLDSSPDAIKKGTQQFETPEPIAEALAIPLTPYRGTICDLTCGHGNLLRACRNETTTDLVGIDISPAARSKDVHTIIADVNKVFPLLGDAGVEFDLFVLNPPFSLRWPDQEGKGTVDSTVRTWQMALHLLSKHGEGMMICNAATAARLIGDDEHIWLRLILPDFFASVGQDMKIAVLYFSADGRRNKDKPPEELILDNAFPDTLREILKPYRGRGDLCAGSRIRTDWVRNMNTNNYFTAVRDEWKRLEDEAAGKRVWNISLRPDGTINRYLTPFERISDRAPSELVEELNLLQGKNPMELVVQRSTRVALQKAVDCGIWRVQPALIEAVRVAVASYNSVRAPFVKLNDLQRLGYLDENETIRCKVAIDGSFVPDAVYRLTTQTFLGVKEEKRKRIGKAPETVEVTGQELLIKIIDSLGRAHAFTQFPLSPAQTKEYGIAVNHGLQALVDNFIIPEVDDVATTQPERFNEYKARLLSLQHL